MRLTQARQRRERHVFSADVLALGDRMVAAEMVRSASTRSL